MDDLCSFNNGDFEINYNDIFSDELELKKPNKDTCKTSFCIFQEEFMRGIVPLSVQ